MSCSFLVVSPFSFSSRITSELRGFLLLWSFDMTTRDMNLHFISWNLKGANEPIKCNNEKLKQLRDTFFLQETQLKAFKAFMHRQMISYVLTLSKAENSELEAITKEILRVDNMDTLTPIPALFKECLQLQSKFDLLSTSKTQKQLLLVKQHFFFRPRIGWEGY